MSADAVDLGRERQRVEDADDREPAAADPDLHRLVEVGDAEPLRGDDAEHDRRVAARAPRRGSGPSASVAAERRRAATVGRHDRRARPSRSASMRSVRRTVAPSAVDRARAPRPGRSAGSSRARRRAAWRPRRRTTARARRSAGSSRAGRAARAAPPGSTSEIAEHGDHRRDADARCPSAVSADRSRRAPGRRPPSRTRSTGRAPSRAGPPRVTARPTRGHGTGVSVRCRSMPRRRAATVRPLSRSIRPSRSSTRRGSDAARSRSWVMTTIVVPVRRVELAEQRRGSMRPVAESRLPVGSSARTIAGRPTSARAMATRCRSPPDSCSGRWCAAMPQADPLERRARRPARRARARDAAVQQPVGDVVERGLAAEQVELLEHEPDPPRAERRTASRSRQAPPRRTPAMRTVAGRRPVERAEEVQQGRLARTRRPDDARAARRRSIDQIDVAERRRPAARPGRRFDDADELGDRCRAHDGTTTASPSVEPVAADLDPAVLEQPASRRRRGAWRRPRRRPRPRTRLRAARRAR